MADINVIWCETGGKIDPHGKYTQGWNAEVPISEHINYTLNKQTVNIRALAEHGSVAKWTGTEHYTEHSVVLAGNGVRYTSNGDSPTSDPSHSQNGEWESVGGEAPLGTAMFWGSPTPPAGWVIAAGQSTTGMDQAIIDLYGDHLPDMRGEFVTCHDDSDTNRAPLTHQDDNFGDHSHSCTVTAQFHGNPVPPHKHTVRIPHYVTDNNSYGPYDGGVRNNCRPSKYARTVPFSMQAPTAKSATASVTIGPSPSAKETRCSNVAFAFIIHVGG